jgi:hypothetical protein
VKIHVDPKMFDNLKRVFVIWLPFKSNDARDSPRKLMNRGIE